MMEGVRFVQGSRRTKKQGYHTVAESKLVGVCGGGGRVGRGRGELLGEYGTKYEVVMGSALDGLKCQVRDRDRDRKSIP